MDTDTDPNSASHADEHFPLVAHVVPFVAWLFIMQMLGDPAGWKYAVRTGVCVLLFLVLRPWRWYAGLQVRNLGWAVLVGVGVFLAWIVGESDFLQRWPTIRDAYATVGFMPPWKMAELTVNEVYSPAISGWSMTLLRIAGSAFVISFIEEFFWRGFLYRWLLAKDFLRVDLNRFDLRLFLLVALVFGLEHQRWLAGTLAGMAYGWMLLRTRDIWAVGLAHALTNLLLGLYVVWAEKWQFWS